MHLFVELSLPYGSLYVILWDIYGGSFWVGDHYVEGDPRSVLIGEDILCSVGANKQKLSNLCGNKRYSEENKV